MTTSSLSRFRIIALLEGISFLILLFIAMPLKYMAGLPLMVKYVGWAHGALFILFILALIPLAIERSWSWKNVSWSFLASLLPFGTFVLDAKLLRKEQEQI